MVNLPRDVIVYGVLDFLEHIDLINAYIGFYLHRGADSNVHVRLALSHLTLEQLYELNRSYPCRLHSTALQHRLCSRVDDACRFGLIHDLPSVFRLIPPYSVMAVLAEAVVDNRSRVVHYLIATYNAGILLGLFERRHDLPRQRLADILASSSLIRKRAKRYTRRLRRLLPGLDLGATDEAS